jgi:WD40 repeat protein/serine/threonine protein kinase
VDVCTCVAEAGHPGRFGVIVGNDPLLRSHPRSILRTIGAIYACLGRPEQLFSRTMPVLSMPNPQAESASGPREVFLAALECGDEAEREAVIAKACGEDKALRQKVEYLLREEKELGGFLEKPAMEGARDTTLMRPATGFDGEQNAVLRENEGELIGPYKLLQKIGEGGCGRVYMAEQVKSVRRRVALKIIKLGMDTRNVIARFESERQALALMDHSNIARVLDAGSTETGRPYFVMELVRGIPITEYCDKEKLSARERLGIFIQVSNAIQHAHQKGIIHCDIKPSNILVTLHDGVPVPKIIDFGIAKATEQRLTDNTLFTEYQAFIGTPVYMSPEQAEMSGLDIDTRSDIYALGVLLYELLVGQTPFDAETLRNVGLDECRRTIRETEPAPPSTRFSTMLDAEQTDVARHRHTHSPHLIHLLRGDLDWIVMKCLEKDRRRRYATVNELVLDIKRHLEGEAVLARPPSTLYRIQKLVRRHRGVFAAAACLIASLIAGIAVSTRQMLRAQDAEQHATEAEAAKAALLQQAREGWNRAKVNERAARLNTYVADINLAHHALEDGHFGRARKLIEKHQPAPGQSEEDLLGFEWRFLAGLCQGDAHIGFPNQDGAVDCVAISPGGDVLAAGTRNQVNVWDVRSRTLITTLPTGARSIVFLPDGKTFVTAAPGTVRVWNSDSFSGHTELLEQEGPITLSGDGTRMATTRIAGKRQGAVQILDPSGWREVALLEGASSPTALSTDGSLIATNSRDGITLWNPDTGKAIRVLNDSAGLFPRFMSTSQTLTFSPDGKFVIAPRNTFSDRGVFVVSIWDVNTGEEVATMPSSAEQLQHTGVISTLAFSSDGTTLATGSWDHSIRLWNFQSREHLTTLRGQSNEIWAVAFSPDGQTLAAGGKDGSLNLWPASEPEDNDTIRGQWQPLAFAPGGRQLAAVDRDGTVGFFDLESRKKTRSITLDSGNSSFRSHVGRGAVAISADLKTLVNGRGDGTVQIWDTETRETIDLVVSSRRVSSIALSPDARLLVAGGRGQPLTIWDLHKPKTADPMVTIEADRALFSADDGTLIALSGRGDTVEVWDTASLTKRNHVEIEPRPGSSVAVSPDGGILATTASSGDFNNAIRLWDTSSGELLGECTGHKQGVWSVAFSPDGKTLTTSSDDSTLKFWNITTRQEMFSIRRVGTTLTSLTFSPDGQCLVGAGNPFSTSGELRLLRAPPYEEIDRWLSPPSAERLPAPNALQNF